MRSAAWSAERGGASAAVLAGRAVRAQVVLMSKSSQSKMVRVAANQTAEPEHGTQSLSGWWRL